MNGNVRLRCVCLLMIALVGTGARANAHTKGVCDIRVGKRFAVYQVMVGGEVHLGKGYVTYQEALNVRDVLLSVGTCKTVAEPKACVIKTLAAFDFAIFRDGENFDRYAKLRTLKQAQAYAQALVKNKLCVMKDS